MKKIVLLGLAVLTLNACSVTTGKDIIKTYNLGKNLNKITTSGVMEEGSNCIKNIFDPSRNQGVCN